MNLKLQKLVKGFDGDIGIYVQSLKTGKTAQINADRISPTSSMIKVPINTASYGLLWNYYAPSSNWKPAEAIEKYGD